jgi:hypothetical protein
MPKKKSKIFQDHRVDSAPDSLLRSLETVHHSPLSQPMTPSNDGTRPLAIASLIYATYELRDKILSAFY